MTIRFPYFILLGFSLLWCTGIYITPFLVNEQTAVYLYTAYHQVCHQLADHSFHIHGSNLSVCIRCSALYTAFLAGVLLFPLIRTNKFSITSNRYYIILLAVPMIVDVVASWTTGYSSTIASRVVSGGLFGFGASLLITPLFIEALQQLYQSRPTVTHSNNHGGYK